ncbi:penicillin-binding protein 2 [bacterium]|nr:penicillin-binding protein 2 [bacterium]
MNRRNGHSEAAQPERARRIVLLAGILFALLVLRLFQIQVISSGGYLRLSRDNQFRELRIPAPRGLILDRNGKVLAKNQAACEASLAIRSAERNPGLLARLAALMDKDEFALAAAVTTGRAAGAPRVILERSLERSALHRLEEELPSLPGLDLRDWECRYYPLGPGLAHLIGYVGEVREDELVPDDRTARAYRPGDLVGRSGLEKTYESVLRGTDGKEMILVDARGTELETVQSLFPEPGQTLVLTLDLELCAQLDSALTYWGAGAGVVMDVHTGEILAATSRPAFDPNALVGGIPTALWRELSEDPGKPLFNRLTQATYSPGSTFKPVVQLAGLERGLITRETHFRGCTGGLRLGNRVFHCWEERGHGSLAAVDALARSCDVYFYQLGERLGADHIAWEARRLGLGAKSGGDFDSESRGLVPDRAWYDKRFGKRGWSTGSVWNIAIGQGELLVNVVQMARLYAALGNGGFLPVPRLRHHLEDVAGNTTLPFSPVRGERLGLDLAALATVRQGMENVLGGGGTAAASALRDFPTAGKTGTVQNPHGKEHAYFCGYAPADNPEIAVALIVEHGEHGSSIAPIFRQLVVTHFKLDVAPLRRERPGFPVPVPAPAERRP